MLAQCRINAYDLSVGFSIHEARVAVESVAADAGRIRQHLAVALIQQDSNRQMEGMMSLALQAIEQLLDAGLIRNRRVGIGFLPRGLGRSSPRSRGHETAPRQPDNKAQRHRI